MTDDVQKTEQANMTNNLMRTEKAKQADKEWDDLKRELETLGDQVKSLRDHAGALGETVLGNMELRFQDVMSRANAYRNTTAAQMEELQKLALTQADQAQVSLTEQGKKSAEMAKDKARELWTRAEPLRQGAQELAQQMQENRQGPGNSPNGRQLSSRPDPLGRRSRPDNRLNDERTKVPDQMDTERAREILDTIRRRLGDIDRPAEEKDYLERLIDRF